MPKNAEAIEAHKANPMRNLYKRGYIDIVKFTVLQGWLDDQQ